LVLEPQKNCIIFKRLDEKIKEVLLKKKAREEEMETDKFILGNISRKCTRKRWNRFYEKKKKGYFKGIIRG
jgi:hypothetical protein